MLLLFTLILLSLAIFAVEIVSFRVVIKALFLGKNDLALWNTSSSQHGLAHGSLSS